MPQPTVRCWSSPVRPSELPGRLLAHGVPIHKKAWRVQHENGCVFVCLFKGYLDTQTTRKNLNSYLNMFSNNIVYWIVKGLGTLFACFGFLGDELTPEHTNYCECA